MAMMVGVVGALSAFYPDSAGLDARQRTLSAIRLIAKMPTIAAIAYKTNIGQPVVYPQTRLAFAENFLYMMFATPCEPYEVNPTHARALETILVLHNGRLTSIESKPGCHWAAACCRSMRAVTNQDIVWNMPLLKMLDKTGVPIQVSAILVYRVVDAKKAALDIDDYNSFVRSLGTAALKQVVQQYTYDELKVEGRAISEQIVTELQERVIVAGAQVDSMTLNELNYAPEIASAMLKKQQAGALIEARELISDGAVQISMDAVGKLEKSGKLKLNEDAKVRIVTNLLTICCGEENAKPVLTL